MLPIQGPPGTGKTFTGSHMILELIKAGKKVGVTAVSHEVIRNLLKGVCERAEEAGLEDFKCLQKGKAKDDDPAALHSVDDNDKAGKALRGGSYRLLGGTAWLWARSDFRDSVDVLFIDEAGQMSLADVLAVSPGAKSLVLLGDPQQLEQPQQASHPPGTGASALEHLLGGARTVAADRGLFLGQTRRLHPKICAFTAEMPITPFAVTVASPILPPEAIVMFRPALVIEPRFCACSVTVVRAELAASRSSDTLARTV